MAPSVVFNPNKCIRCGSCVESCRLQGIEALRMDESEGVVIDDSKCVRCGQCVLSCPLSFPDKTVKHIRDMLDCNMCPMSAPSGAVTEKDDTALVIEALNNRSKYLVLQIAPSVRVTAGEEFGLESGGQTVKKLYSAFRKMGFDKVGDTNFSADLTVMEEGTEFLSRLGGGALPLFTSCCPAWVKFAENNYPRLTPHLSTAKSPQQMFGAVAKTAAAKKLGIDPSAMFVVSVMPCTAKKYERARMEFDSAFRYWQRDSESGQGGGGRPAQPYPAGYPDVDAALTTRECVKLLKL
ncbi:MAG: 4Fe-4S binding protein, partial [Treponema sp.]|nr:4Fe-4S binding protein [Treponema sp.]